MTDMIKIIEELSNKALDADDPASALQYSQAAQNVSHAMITTLNAGREFGKYCGRERKPIGLGKP